MHSIFLLLASAGICLGALQHYTISALNEASFNAFMDCMVPDMEQYSIKTEDGWIALAPIEPRLLSPASIDLTLFNCMEDHQSLLLEAQSSFWGTFPAGNRRNLTGTSYEWMLQNGASGKAKSLAARTVERDDTASYDFYGSIETDCSDEDHKTSAVENCYSVTKQYPSSQFGNPTFCSTLHATAWPHHSCQKGDSSMVVVAPEGISPCKEKDVFSWSGNYVHARTCAPVPQRL